MAQYQVRGPDGQVHVFAGPDGATPEQVIAAASQIFSAAHQKAQADTAAWQQTVNPINGMDAWDRGAAGAGKALVDMARGAGQWLGLENRQDVAQSRAQDAPLMATTGGKVGNFIGQAAPAVVANIVAPGVGSTILGGAGMGAAQGAIQPSTSTGETALNIGLGAAAGAAVPLASRLIQVGKAAAEPFYEAGKNRIVGRALNAAAGTDAPQVAQRLQQAATPFVGPSQGVQRTVMGEYVPGSLPTVGQAAENPGVAALERAATAGNPEVTNAVSQQMAAQNAARVGSLDNLAGTDGARTFADEMRSGTANQLYEQAYQKGINLQRNAATGQFNSKAQVAATKGEITKLMQRPAIQEAMTDARTLAANEGVNITDPAGSVKGLDYVKRALDDKIAKATGNEQRILVDLKNRLLTTIDRLSPDYAQARATFAEMSRPINQMDVAQSIVDKSVNKLTGNLQPQAYAKALSDSTAASATGLRSATLESTMEPAQMNALNSILLDLQRANAAQNVGRGPGSDTVQKMAYSNLLEQAGVPTWLRAFAPAQVAGNLVARGADAAYGRANRELSNRLAAVMLDPQEAATVMFTATPQTQNALAKYLLRAASVPALAAPASANAQKQQ